MSKNNTHLSILNSPIKLHEGLYSLNDLHKASGGLAKHKPANFLRIEQTQELIAEIEQFSDMRSASEVINGGTESNN